MVLSVLQPPRPPTVPPQDNEFLSLLKSPRVEFDSCRETATEKQWCKVLQAGRGAIEKLALNIQKRVKYLL